MKKFFFGHAITDEAGIYPHVLIGLAPPIRIWKKFTQEIAEDAERAKGATMSAILALRTYLFFFNPNSS